MRYDISDNIKDGRFTIKLNYDKGNYNFSLEFWELFMDGKLIATDCNWNSPSYLFNLKNRLKNGEELNWWTKFKAKWC